MEKNYKNWDRVLYDDFSEYEIGPFSDGYSAQGEVHYPPKTVDQGHWEEISIHHSWNKRHNPDFPNWKIIAEDGNKALKQTCENRLNRKNWKYPIKKLFFKSRLQILMALPAIAVKDRDYTDYYYSVEMKPLSKIDLAGIIFRMIDPQHHYVFALRRNKTMLLYRTGNELRKLAAKRFDYEENKYYRLSVSVENDTIRCFIDDVPVLVCKDSRYASGRIGLISNVPTVYGKTELYVEPSANRNRSEKDSPKVTLAGERKDNEPLLWKKFSLPVAPSGRSIRFGDLTGNAVPDVLIAHGKKVKQGDNYNMIGCLTAIDLDGNVIWQKGEPDENRECFNSDLAFQIYDVDGDGDNEVICTRDYFLEILDGKTGETKLKIPTPESVPPHNEFPQIIGDSIYICNITGAEAGADILLKDRYSKVWAYDNRLNLQWEYRSKYEMGHYAYAIDFDNDGRDEILVGHSLLNHKGEKKWELALYDHSDAGAVVPIPGTDEYQVVIASSDEGMVFADMNGNIKKKLPIGHMQTVTMARLIHGSPEYQIVTNTYWGTPGIIYILDVNGNILNSLQPSLLGSPIPPVNWDGDGWELILLSAAADGTGGLYDGLGNQVVQFPDDGHPTMCYDALDLDGDGLDELVFWDFDEMWLYRRKDRNVNDPVAVPRRFPAVYNASNYRANISLSA